MSKILWKAITVLLVISVVVPSVLAAPAADVSGSTEAKPVQQPPEPNKYGFERVEAEIVDINEIAVYIVQLQDPALPSYRGDIKGLEATNPELRGESKLDADAPASVAYMDYLAQKQAEAIAEVNSTLGRSIDVLYTYKAALNGFAAEMTAAEADIVSKLPSIKYIEREHEYTLDTDYGPAWMGADGIWDGSMTGGLDGTYGEGVIIGVIDTGIDPWNPSFADVGGDGYDHTNPWGADTYVGVCDADDPSYDPTFPCNDKLIGAWGYASVNDGDPRDADGHGSHTASTAGGNVVHGAVITTPTDVYTANISGVAPHANIVAYAACCTGAALTAAKEQVILDEVDVVNYSIGYSGGTADLWASADTQAWLNVRDAGIFVASSAGNDGPAAATMGGPGDAPWMLTVGASSHNRAFLNSVILDNGTTTTTVDGLSMTGAYGPAPVVYASDYITGDATAEDARLCAPGAFPAGTFDGEIVVCERGEYGRVAKGQSVADGGAGGYILAQPNEVGGGPGSLVSDPHVLPAVHIDYYGYQTLQSIVTGTEVVSGTIVGTTMDVDDSYGDVMASFSSRGPIRSELFVKPDVTAPGRSIWAAYHQGDEDGDYTFNVIGGTSMSSPHAAGAAALLRALYPDWTPAQIQSAMMTTARNETVVDEDGTSKATAFEQGAGHVALGHAAQAGFVLDVTTQEFTDANPATGGDPTALNLASLANNQCIGMCSWTRVLSSTQDANVSWTATTDVFTDGITLTVTPATFDLAAGATQMITVEADISGLPNDVWAFGEVMLTATDVPTAHFPVAVKGSTGVLPDVLKIDVHRNAGSRLVKNLKGLEIVTMTVDTYGLAEATQFDFQLYEDPTNDIPGGFFDDLSQVYWTTMTVQANDMRLVAEIVDTTSPDLDMAVGRDLDGDGPEESEIVCQSATGTAYEYCDVSGDDLVAGDWWVVVLNWSASVEGQQDDVTLAMGTVPGTDSGNMTITGPDSVPVNTEFDIRLFWNTPSMEVGDHWYGAFAIGTDPDHQGNVGMVPVNIARVTDAVSKTVSSPVFAGDIVNYTIIVQPNDTNEDITYHITDTFPSGATYVSGSASADLGVVNVVGNQLTWTGVMETPVGKVFDYDVSTNASDPLCDTGFGGYVNLANFGIYPQEGITGTNAWSAFANQNPVQFYGVEKTGINFTDDGLAFFDSELGDNPEVNTDLPNPAVPNDLLAIFWNDMNIVYEEEVRGVSLASAGSDLSIIEYDDVEPASGGTNRYDFEVIVNSTIDNSPGAYEFVYAYDNIHGYPNSATIGVENMDGTAGTEFLFGDPSTVITDGLIVCFDYESLEAVEITYQVIVPSVPEPGDTIVNHVCHDTDTPGTEEDCFDVTTTVQGPVPHWNKEIWISGDGPYAPTDTPFEGIVPTDTVTIVDEVMIDYTENISFTLMEEWSESFELGDYELAALPGGTLLLPPDGTLMPPSGVFTEDGSLTLKVYNMPSEWGYVLTKTFSIVEGDWTMDYLTETLHVEDTLEEDQLDDVVLTFQHAEPEEAMIYLPLVMRNY